MHRLDTRTKKEIKETFIGKTIVLVRPGFLSNNKKQSFATLERFHEGARLKITGIAFGDDGKVDRVDFSYRDKTYYLIGYLAERFCWLTSFREGANSTHSAVN